MSRTPIIVGNWKLNKTISEALALVTEIKNAVSSIRNVEVGVGPVATALHSVAKRLEDSKVGVAAQNCFWEERGAWTGELAPSLLKDAGCRYVIVGHSERRTHFGEHDDNVGRKVRAVIDADLTPIICFGETEGERADGQTFSRIETQLHGALSSINAEELANSVLAYEPVWAIGTGQTATPGQAQEVHAHVRAKLRSQFGDAADKVRIQYGGSVKPNNSKSLLSQADIDGALVGGASLKAADFVEIIRSASA